MNLNDKQRKVMLILFSVVVLIATCFVLILSPFWHYFLMVIR